MARNRIFRLAVTSLSLLAIVRNEAQVWAFSTLVPQSGPRKNAAIHSSDLFAVPVDGDTALIADDTSSSRSPNETAKIGTPQENTATEEPQKASDSRKEEDDAMTMLDSESISIFEIVAGRAATCLVESDMSKDAKAGYGNKVSSGATNWINDATAFALQKAFDRIQLKVRQLQQSKNVFNSQTKYSTNLTNIFCVCVSPL
jgi:hypothetical protein